MLGTLLLVCNKVLARSADTAAVGALVQALVPHVTANLDLGAALLSQLSSDEALLRDLLFNNAVHAVRAAVVDLLSHALRVLAPLESAALLELEEVEVCTQRTARGGVYRACAL